jgi:hypothetical protein
MNPALRLVALLAAGTLIAADTAAPIAREPVQAKLEGENLYVLGFDKLSAFASTTASASRSPAT